MGIKLIKCKVTSGIAPSLRTYYFLGPKGTYTAEFATASGIVEADDTDNDEPNTAVKELLLAGTVRRKKLRTEKAGKIYNLTVLVSKLKNATFEDDITGKTVNTDGTVSEGAKVLSVIDSRKRSLY